jgi:hypothetical protein
MTNSGISSPGAPSGITSKWYLLSLADHDTHRGWVGGDGAVLALCGAQFIPKPTVRQVGQRLVDGFPDLGSPPIREQVCQVCQGAGVGR